MEKFRSPKLTRKFFRKEQFLKVKWFITIILSFSLSFNINGQIIQSYTASLVTYANQYVEKTKATMTVLIFNNDQEIKYQDEESVENLYFTKDSVYGHYIEQDKSTCGRGLTKDYIRDNSGRFKLNKKDVKVINNGSKELVSGFLCEEVIISYVYRISGIEVACRNHIWVSSDIKCKGILNFNDFNEVWIPRELDDSIKKAENLVLKQEIYFNEDKVGTAMVEEFKVLSYVPQKQYFTRPECKSPVGIKKYKRIAQSYRRAKDSFNRLSGE